MTFAPSCPPCSCRTVVSFFASASCLRSQEFHRAIRLKFGIAEDVPVILCDGDGDVVTFPFSGYPSGTRFTLERHGPRNSSPVPAVPALRPLHHPALVNMLSTNTLQHRLAEQQALRRRVLAPCSFQLLLMMCSAFVPNSMAMCAVLWTQPTGSSRTARRRC